MKYTEVELLNCLIIRRDWYLNAIECFKNNAIFDYPEGGITRWQGAANELQNTIDMMQA